MKPIYGFLALVAVILPLHAMAQQGNIARAQFTSGILDREPVDNVTSLDNQTERVMFFTELRNMENKTIVHRWELNGEVMAAITFNVRGPRWRVHSSKELLPEWTGKWVVTVLDENGAELGSYTLNYGPNGMSSPSGSTTTN